MAAAAPVSRAAGMFDGGLTTTDACFVAKCYVSEMAVADLERQPMRNFELALR